MSNQTKSEQKLDEMTQLIKYSHELKVPYFRRTLVKTEELEQCISEFKTIIREELEESEGIKNMHSEIIKEARDEAAQIRQRARQEIEGQDQVQEAYELANRISKDAREEANEILKEAKKIKQELIEGGYRFLQEMMEVTENQITQSQEQLSEQQHTLLASKEKIEMMFLSESKKDKTKTEEMA